MRIFQRQAVRMLKQLGVCLQVERFVDRKVDQAENIVRKKQKKAKNWYDINIDGDNSFRVKESHIFYASFVAGLCFGFVSS